MQVIVGVFLIAAICIICIKEINRLCRQYSSIAPWSNVMLVCFFVWVAATAHRALVWAPSVGRGGGYDGALHDLIAHDLSDRLQRGSISIFDLGWLSNDGYRSSLAIFYTLTDAPLSATFAVHAMFAFCGLLLVLESCALVSDSRRLPLWLVGYTLMLPSALIFTPWIIKEGPVLWGIALVMRFGIGWRKYSKQIGSILLSSAGAIVLFSFRPHVAIAWLVAAVASHMFAGTKPLKSLIGVGMMMVGYWVTLTVVEYIVPGFYEKVGQDGVVNTLDRMTSRGEGGSAIYRISTPIPILNGLLFTFFEPNPFHWAQLQFAVVGCEAWFITLAIAYKWHSAKLRDLSTQRSLQCLILILLMGFYLGYMYNMGLMVRQRLQVMPALILLAAIPMRERRDVVASRSSKQSGLMNTGARLVSS